MQHHATRMEMVVIDPVRPKINGWSKYNLGGGACYLESILDIWELKLAEQCKCALTRTPNISRYDTRIDIFY